MCVEQYVHARVYFSVVPWPWRHGRMRLLPPSRAASLGRPGLCPPAAHTWVLGLSQVVMAGSCGLPQGQA